MATVSNIKGVFMRSGLIKKSLFLFASCFFGSCVLGVLFYGSSVFNPNLIYFQFLGSGAIAAAMVVARKFGGFKAILGVGTISLLMLLALMPSEAVTRIVRNIAWVVSLGASVWLAVFVSSRAGGLRVMRFLFWTLAFGVCHLAMFGILTLANGVSFDPSQALVATQVGALVGAGVGLGAEIYELFGHNRAQMAA